MIQIERKYERVVYLLGGCPRREGDAVVCDSRDFHDAVCNLMVHRADNTFLEDGSDIDSELESLRMTPSELLEHLIRLKNEGEDKK